MHAHFLCSPTEGNNNQAYAKPARAFRNPIHVVMCQVLSIIPPHPEFINADVVHQPSWPFYIYFSDAYLSKFPQQPIYKQWRNSDLNYKSTQQANINRYEEFFVCQKPMEVHQQEGYFTGDLEVGSWNLVNGGC